MYAKTETRVGLFVLIALAIFAYMGFRIGAFRFDRGNYNEYTVAFEDISGLSRKSDVKIAGVKVGWVEQVELIPTEQKSARADVMVHKNYRLYENAHGTVRQDGLLGPKYVELVPGDPELKTLISGTMLSRPSIELVSIDELMHEFKLIATNVRDVTDSFKEAIGGDEGSDRLVSFIQDLSTAAENISSFSRVLDRAFTENEEHVDTLLQLGTTISRVVDSLEQDVLPSFQSGIEKISDVFDRDFNRIATNIENVAQSFDEAAIEARDGLHSISAIATKIDEGTGLIGKLVNEDETYRDLKIAVEGIKNYVTKVDRLQIVMDTHSERMHRPAENYEWEDTKGYFEARIYPLEDYFFLIQYMQTEKGFLSRTEKEKDYIDRRDCDVIITDDLLLNDGQKLINTAGVREKKLKFFRDAGALSIQVGKIFGDIALRTGLFDGSAGVAADLDIPIRSDNFRWVTSLELFDMNGRNRIDDRRPHLKWFNKMYVMRNIYVVFGADDFASKRNASAFYGFGLRFADDDIKYFMGSFSGLFSGIGT